MARLDRVIICDYWYVKIALIVIYIYEIAYFTYNNY